VPQKRKKISTNKKHKESEQDHVKTMLFRLFTQPTIAMKIMQLLQTKATNEIKE